MTYFLDTNICVFYLNGNYPALSEKFDSLSISSMKIPSVVAAELYYGVEKSEKREYNLARYNEFLSVFEIVDFDLMASRVYGKIRAALEVKGQVIGSNDMMIAATVLTHDAVLVTNNIKEFKRIDNLVIDDWT